MWLIYGLSTLFRWSLCLFLCQYQTVLITVALYYSPNSRNVIPPALFFPKIFFFFFLKFRVFCIFTKILKCCTSEKKYLWYLIGIALNLWIALSSIIILTVLLLPIQEIGLMFPFFFIWRIIALQNFVVFCQVSTWISHRYTSICLCVIRIYFITVIKFSKYSSCIRFGSFNS